MTLERLGAALSDRYRLERELGQGGMATVYLAERFLSEIKTTANLQHPRPTPPPRWIPDPWKAS